MCVLEIIWETIEKNHTKEIKLNFYIVVKKSYLYNYSEKITVWLVMS